MITALMDEDTPRARPWDAAHVAREADPLALDSAARAGKLGLDVLIIISCKVSGVQEPSRRVWRSLRRAAGYTGTSGLTEAGMGSKGIVASTAALAVLLQQGIGDHDPASLTPRPNRRVRARSWLRRNAHQGLVRTCARSPMVTACPGFDAASSSPLPVQPDVQEHVRAKMPRIAHQVRWQQKT